MLACSKTVAFSSLKNPIAIFSEHKCIATSRVKKFLADVVHYHLDLPIVIRSLVGNYTEEYRDTCSTLKTLRVARYDKLIINDVKYTLLTGYPNKIIASSLHANFIELKRCGNHTTIKKNFDQVINTLNKEDRNQYLLLFPNWLARFFKNIHLTPQGLLFNFFLVYI